MTDLLCPAEPDSTFSMSYYKEKIAYVFGASEGIGAAVSEALCAEGTLVVAFSRSVEKLTVLQENLLKKNKSARIHIVPLDVTNGREVERVLEQIVNKYGAPYFVMNFAGMARPGFIDKLDISEFRKMMDLNYFGTVHVVKALSRYLINQHTGHIVNCSSMAGFLGLFGYTGYCASKFAVIGFSEALKREWAPLGIHVSVLCPPNTRTPGLVEENRTKPAEVLAVEEKAKVVDPEYVAQILLKRLPKKEFLIVPTFDGKMANYLSRVSPRIIDFFVKRESVT